MSGFAAELRRKRSAALTPEAATITGTSADCCAVYEKYTAVCEFVRRVQTLLTYCTQCRPKETEDEPEDEVERYSCDS